MTRNHQEGFRVELRSHGRLTTNPDRYPPIATGQIFLLSRPGLSIRRGHSLVGLLFAAQVPATYSVSAVRPLRTSSIVGSS